jgi:arylformamidase
MSGRLIDISPPITPQIAVWPGDVPFSRNENLSIENGANIDLSSISTTVHLGAHTDGPSHYVGEGQGIGERDLSYYYGEAQVITVDVARGERIRHAHLSGPIMAPRVLFRTRSYPDPNVFNDDFCSLSPALIEWLAQEGVRLVGIDTPSIDPASSKDLPSHAMVAAHDMAILEGIVLDQVSDGVYTLIALPLRILGADASPVRAVLVDHTQ